MGSQHSAQNKDCDISQDPKLRTYSPQSNARTNQLERSPRAPGDKIKDTFSYSPHRDGRNENKQRASQRSQLKNSISGLATPRKASNQIVQEEDVLKKPHSKAQQNLKGSAQIRNDNKFATAAPNNIPKTTKSEHKKFAFDQSDAKKQRNHKKSIDFVETEVKDVQIKVYYEHQKYVTIAWSSKQPNLTVGWLYSETIRTLQHLPDFNPLLIPQMTVFRNMNHKCSECYDYLLTQVDGQVSFSFIQNGDSLQVLYSQERYLKNSIMSTGSNFSPGMSDHQNSQHKKDLSLEDFEFVKVIGKGGFSKVFQVRLKATGQLYAMKTLSKQKIKRDNKVDNIINERKILEKVKGSHPFIIQMACAFTNEDYLFLVLEFCAGGELFYKLSHIAGGKMNESQARFYFAEILTAIEFLHQNDILYRDLKPENIVIDELGHIKLTDFGLSKVDFKREHRAYSFCGSPEYMAPEMLATERNRMTGSAPMYHNMSLDFYHLGALLYEMLCGLPPFFSENRDKMYKDIVYNSCALPDHLSGDCKKLLKGLLEKNPARRLGSQRGAQEIKEHPWLKDMNWDKLLKKEIPPPFKPFLTKSNFDAEYTSMDPILEDDEPLVPLSELEDAQPVQHVDCIDGFDALVNQSPTKQVLNRQHSIELYERENNTFRGYSFLQSNGEIYGEQNHLPINYYNSDHQLFFNLADSKDHSLTEIGGDLDYSLEHGNAQENELMKAFAVESKNKQSQLSVLSEDIGAMKNNLQLISSYNSGNGQNPLRVMMDKNYMSNQPNAVRKQEFIIQQQLSNERDFNALMSSFDYPLSKKVKESENEKLQINQTESTISLFSNNQQQNNAINNYLNNVGNDQNELYTSNSNLKTLEEKKEKRSLGGGKAPKKKQQLLEFQSHKRQYSPEIDMGSILLQHKKQSGGLKHQNSLIGDSTKRPQSTIKGQKLPVGKDKKNANNFSTSEYHTLGSTLSKKRASEMSTNSKQSPDVRQSQQLRNNMQKSQKKNPNNESSTSHIAHQTKLKTSQLYSQVSQRITNPKKSRNLSSQGENTTMTRKETEECKIESSYQTLQVPMNVPLDSNDQFIVKQISTNEYLGSFVTANSNREGTDDERDKLNETHDRELMVAVLLNQSHESCCCSDDEFQVKGQTSPSKSAVKPTKKLQYVALEEKIQKNHKKHFQATQTNKPLPTEPAQEEGALRHATTLDQKSISFLQTHSNDNDEVFSPVNSETTHNSVKGFKSSNASIIGYPIERLEHNLVKNANNSAKKIKKTAGGLPLRINSPNSQQQLILNKTAVISPMRSNIGGSKLKERPSISKGGQQCSATPKGDTKGIFSNQSKQAQALNKLSKQANK